MGKKTTPKKQAAADKGTGNNSIRRIFISITVCTAIIALVWAFNSSPNLYDAISQYIENGDFITLEARYTPEQIMNAHRQELLADDERTFKEATLKFYPHLLIESKYIDQEKKTKEGTLLWSLVDGEVVINAETWERTHGFQDALLSDANRDEFKVLNALMHFGGTLTKEKLQRELNVEKETLEHTLESVRRKHLIIQKGILVQLHIQNPKIGITPQTKISQWFVTKPYNYAQRIPQKFSKRQIERTAKAAFGNEFTIRSTKEVALPVYGIEVLNPDGSVHTTFWNALTGQRMHPRSLGY
jgi:hypothetical protein